jgi:hypothetical protein
MAAFNTIVARTGFVDEMRIHLNNKNWNGLDADNQADAIQAANEKFEDDATRSDWEVSPESTDAYEIFEGENLIGWDIDAGGWPIDND